MDKSKNESRLGGRFTFPDTALTVHRNPVDPPAPPRSPLSARIWPPASCAWRRKSWRHWTVWPPRRRRSIEGADTWVFRRPRFTAVPERGCAESQPQQRSPFNGLDPLDRSSGWPRGCDWSPTQSRSARGAAHSSFGPGRRILSCALPVKNHENPPVKNHLSRRRRCAMLARLRA